MKKLLLLLAIAPIFAFSQISVNKVDTSLNIVVGSNLVKFKSKDWVQAVTIALSQKGAPNGVPALDGVGKITAEYFSFGGIGDIAGPLDATGKIPASQLPPLDHEVGSAATEAEMLALVVTAPAICIRTDFTPAKVFYLSANPATTLANWHDTGSFSGAAANPTATIGLATTNGVAGTLMRSDAAPALSQAIAPTWTAKHTFGLPSTATIPTVALTNTNPEFDFNVTNGAADNKRWNIGASGALWSFRALNDAGVASNAWTVTRAAAAVSRQDWYVGGTDIMSLSATSLTVLPPQTIATSADGYKLWLAKYITGSGHSNAPTTIGATSTYLNIGGREYGNNGYGGIGFSYVGTPADHPAVWLGWQERNTTGSTNGDLVIATRSATTNTAPIERFRITNLGSWALSGLANTGTTGQVISSNGPGSTPTWITPHDGSFSGNIGAPATHTGGTMVNLTGNDTQVQLIDCTAGDVVVDLPDTSDGAVSGKVFTIKKTDASANGVTINGSLGSIDGQASQGLSVRYSVITMVFDGTNWHIISREGA